MKFPIQTAWNEHEMRVDANGRSDLQPVYQGFATPGTSVSDNGWTLYFFEYGAGGDIQRRSIVFKKDWTNRANHFS